jgi:EmrB/QacA subfamily drug resistance transporter
MPARTIADKWKWVGLVVISVAVSLIIVDSTIVNVAIPYVVKDLGINSTQVQWVQEAYTLVFAALLIVFGTMADKWGRKRMMSIGVAIFGISSIIAALAQTGELLIFARVIQGIGGAIILPTTLSIINASFKGKDRGIAFAVWGSTIGGMAALGPLLGGWLTTYFSWRWAFGINVPLGILILIGIYFFVKESRGSRVQKIDVVGAVLSVLTSGLLVFGLIQGRDYGWWNNAHRFMVGDWQWPLDVSPIPFIFGLSLLAGIAFVRWGLYRSRAGKSTILAFDLFNINSFRNGNIAALIVSLGEFGIILSLPIWLQNVLGYTALQTGFVILALAVGSFVASGFAAALSGKVHPVTVVRVGIIAEIIGVLFIGLAVAPGSSWVQIVPWLFVYGFGVGLATAQLTGVVLVDVPVEQSGQGSGTSSTARQVGSALGIAILGTILFTTTSSHLTTKLTDLGLPPEQVTVLSTVVVDSAGGAISGLAANPYTAAVAEKSKEALSDGTKYAAFSAASFLVLGLAATLSLKKHELVTDDHK